MQLDQGTACPFAGFAPCRKLECAMFTKVVGNNPQTGQPIEEWNCAIAWLPLLTIENSQQQRQTAAAVESFRNEMVAANSASQEALAAALSLTQPMIPSFSHTLPPHDYVGVVDHRPATTGGRS